MAPYSVKDVKRSLSIARTFFGSAAAISLLCTLLYFGSAMDSTNFPGANIELAKKDKKLVNTSLGFELTNSINATCSNVAVSGHWLSDHTALCADTGEKNTGWNQGWVIAPNCKRQDTDEKICAPFNANNQLAVFGAIMFVSMGVQTLLFGIQTSVEFVYGDTTDDIDLKSMDRCSQIYLGLNIVWLIAGVGLFVAATLAWLAFCDKIDTGLGRTAKNSEGAYVPSCLYSTCNQSFYDITTLFAVAFFWSRIPHVVAWADPNLEMDLKVTNK